MVKLWSSKPSLWVRIPLPLSALLMRLLNNFFKFSRKVIEQNKQLNILIFLFIDWLLITFKISKLEKKKIDNAVVYQEWEKKLLSRGIFWYYIDYILLFTLSTCLDFKKNFKPWVPWTTWLQLLRQWKVMWCWTRTKLHHFNQRALLRGRRISMR